MRTLEFLDGDTEALDQGLPLRVGRLVVFQGGTNVGQCLLKDLPGGVVERWRRAQLAFQLGNGGSEFFDLHVSAIFEDSQAADHAAFLTCFRLSPIACGRHPIGSSEKELPAKWGRSLRQHDSRLGRFAAADDAQAMPAAATT
jgi:hypothetical protein